MAAKKMQPNGSAQGIDRRIKKRQSLQLLVSYWADGKKHSNFTYDLSVGGMFIETKSPLVSGTQLRMVFEMPHDRSSFEVTGEVTWSSLRSDEQSRPPGMGIKFHTTDAKTAQQLEKAIRFFESISQE